jgi:inactivated superfamily I helicase
MDDSFEIKKEWFKHVISLMENLGSRIDSLEEENKNIKKKLDKLSKRKKDA